MAEACIADFPHTSLLVNSASIFKKDTVATLGPELWEEHLRINALSPILLTRAFHRLCAGQNCVINMLDQKVTNATPDFFSYTISKLALHNATRMLAMSLWPKTRVNGIAPGLVLRSGDQTEEQFRQVHNRTPLGVGPVAGRDLPGRLAAGGDAVDHGPGHHHRRRAAPADQVPVRGCAEGMSPHGRADRSSARPERCIVVDDLRLAFFIGVHEHEKRARQEVSITVYMLVPETGATRPRTIWPTTSRMPTSSSEAEGAGAVRRDTSSWWRRWPRRWRSSRWRTRVSTA